MNYQQANELRSQFDEFLTGKSLVKSPEWIINHLVILPAYEATLLAYTSHIGIHVKEWIATSFDHDFIYLRSGIYILADGRTMPDELTIYALLKNKPSNTYAEYKCEPMSELITQEQVMLGDKKDFVLHLL